MGYVLFSPITINPLQVCFDGIGLAPIAVLPRFQRQGIGSGLIRAGLEECKRAGYNIAIVLGNPRYYSRFDFSRASDYQLASEYGTDKHFMAMELQEEVLAKVKGIVKYQPEFKQAGC